MQEEWRDVPDTDGLVEVSNRGRVYFKERQRHNSTRILPGRMLKPSLTGYGYHEVHIGLHGRWFRERVHRLVAKAFVPGYFEGATVDHIDGDKLNNVPENLEWVSISENTRRQWAAGLNPGFYRGTNVNAKLTDLQVHAIQLLYENNFPPVLLAEWFDVSKSLIEKIGPNRTAKERLVSRASPKLAA